MDNGEVTALAAGAATITATITVEGVDYSDTCEVSVEAIPSEWEVVRDFTSSTVWNDESYWLQQFYIDNTRKTYIEYLGGEAEVILLQLRPGSGSSTTLYADIRPTLEGLTFDTDNYDYALKLNYSNVSATESHPQLSLTTSEANKLIADNWSPFDIPFTADGTVGEEILPLIVRNSGERAFTLQVKHDGNDSGSSVLKWVRFALVRKAK